MIPIFIYFRRRIVHIAEMDSSSYTSILTSSMDIRSFQGFVFSGGIFPCLHYTLNAESTLFHYTTGSYSDFGIKYKIKYRRLLIAIIKMITEIEIIKSSYFIRTVI